MTSVYLDTSVLVAYYVPETFSAQAEAVLLAAADRVVSPLCLSEASAALRAKVHYGHLSMAHAMAARDRFRGHYDGGYYRVIPLENRHYDQAFTSVWQLTQRLRTLDALHLAVAQMGGCCLATADERLRDSALAARLQVAWVGS